MHDGRRDGRCRDVGAREEGELRHAPAQIGEIRAATGVAHDPELQEIAPQVRESPWLMMLDQCKRLVEPSEDDACFDVRTCVLDDHAKAADRVNLGAALSGSPNCVEKSIEDAHARLIRVRAGFLGAIPNIIMCVASSTSTSTESPAPPA